MEESNTFKRNGKILFDPEGVPILKDVCCENLTEVIRMHDKKAAPDESFCKRRSEATDDLRALCHQTFGNGAQVFIFGSCINGFGTQISDIDCFILSKFNLSQPSSYMNPLLKVLRRSTNTFKIVEFVRHAKTPLVTVKHSKTNMELDITFASDMDPRTDVLENSALLNTYAQKDPKIAAVGRFLKFILSQYPQFGSAKIGGLSSYSHIIMLLYFLIHGKHMSHVAVTTPYINREEEITASEGELFLDFLKFYSCEFDSSVYPVDIRYKSVAKKGRGGPGIFTVEDPIIEKNLGKTMAANRVYEIKLFYYRLLCALSNNNLGRPTLYKFVSKLDLEAPIMQSFPQLNSSCKPDAKPKEDKKKRDRKWSKKPKKGDENKPSSSSEAKTEVSTTAATAGANVESMIIVETDEVGLVPNDPYRLEEVMKEIENTPKKKSPVSPAKTKPDKLMGTIRLTEAILEHTTRLERKEEWVVVNYRATDHPGDCRHLVAVPLLAALGFKVPSIQVGNCEALEKMKHLPGFSPNLQLDQMNTMLEETGCFIGYSKELNTVDNKMEHILKSVGSIDSTQLDRARYFAHLTACGTQYYFEDVAWKQPGKDNNYTQSRLSAENITRLTKNLGIKCRTQLSDTAMPYSNMLGHRLELQDAFEILDGEGSSNAVDLLALQCAHMLQMAGKVDNLKEGEKMVFEALSDGSALDKLMTMLAAQGVTSETITQLREHKYTEVWGAAEKNTKVEAKIAGIVMGVNQSVLESFLPKFGGDHQTPAGLQIHVDLGARVDPENTLLTIHHNTDNISIKMANQLRNAFTIQKIRTHEKIIRTFRNEDAGKNKKKSESEKEVKSKRNKRKSESKAEEKKEEVADEGLESSSSTESVPKDYVVVVTKDEDGEETKVVEKREE